MVQDYKFLSKKQNVDEDDKLITILSSRGDHNDDLEMGFDDSYIDKNTGQSHRNALTDKKKAMKFPLTARLAAKEKMILSPRLQTERKAVVWRPSEDKSKIVKLMSQVPIVKCSFLKYSKNKVNLHWTTWDKRRAQHLNWEMNWIPLKGNINYLIIQSFRLIIIKMILIRIKIKNKK